MKSISREKAVVTEFGADLEPALRVGLGETFEVFTNDNAFNAITEDGALERLSAGMTRRPQVPQVNPLAGPIYVEGADPGDTLIVHIDEIEVRDWGWTGVHVGYGPLVGLAEWPDCQGPISVVAQYDLSTAGGDLAGYATVALDRQVTWRLEPFIGTIATAPLRGMESSLFSQGPWGGNIDVREVRVGSSIRLNVAHAGGLLFLGDVHGSQSDAEWTGVANETAARVRLRCEVARDRFVPGVCRITRTDRLIQVDSARNAGDPRAALHSAFVNMMRWLRDEYGMQPREAYLHMSANPDVHARVYQFTPRFFTCGVEFPTASL